MSSKRGGAGARGRASGHKVPKASRRSKSLTGSAARARPAARGTRMKVGSKRAGTKDTGTIGQAALKVARSGARLARYSAAYALVTAKDACQSAIQAVTGIRQVKSGE